MTVTKKQKGPRPRHIPQRSCVACRRIDTKRTLTRLVRDAEGRVSIDTSGKKAGRGAYLCHDPQCWETALRRGGIERALKLAELHPADRAMLEQYAQGLLPADEIPEVSG